MSLITLAPALLHRFLISTPLVNRMCLVSGSKTVTIQFLLFSWTVLSLYPQVLQFGQWLHCTRPFVKLVPMSEWVSDWLLFNANSAPPQLHHGENKSIFNEMMMKSTLFQTNTLSLTFIALTYWSYSPRLDMSLQLDILFWFRANQSLLFLLMSLDFTCIVFACFRWHQWIHS